MSATDLTHSNEQLTSREDEVNVLYSHGFTPEEIADMLGIAWETVRKIISNYKPKVGYQKATECVAEFWCRRFGTSLAEQRKIVVHKFDKVVKCGANVIVILLVPLGILFGSVHDDRRNVRLRQRVRVNQTTRITRSRRF